MASRRGKRQQDNVESPMLSHHEASNTSTKAEVKVYVLMPLVDCILTVARQARNVLHAALILLPFKTFATISND